MKYINKQGIVIEALRWDGTKGVKDDMRLRFNIPAEWVIEVGDYAFQPDYFSHGILKSADYFEKQFKLISDARVLIVEELKRGMLLKLQKCQKNGKLDDWRELGFSVLFQRLLNESSELQLELRRIESGDPSADFGAAREKCVDIANYAAMLHDSLNGMELEAMHESREKNEA